MKVLPSGSWCTSDSEINCSEDRILSQELITAASNYCIPGMQNIQGEHLHQEMRLRNHHRASGREKLPCWSTGTPTAPGQGFLGAAGRVFCEINYIYYVLAVSLPQFVSHSISPVLELGASPRGHSEHLCQAPSPQS